MNVRHIGFLQRKQKQDGGSLGGNGCYRVIDRRQFSEVWSWNENDWINSSYDTLLVRINVRHIGFLQQKQDGGSLGGNGCYQVIDRR